MSEPILNIQPVKRGAAKLVIAFAAPSGEGKTYTALQVALGLAGMDPGKVGMLDTEGRASLYSDIFAKPFLLGELGAPFSPTRYIQAMRQFAEQGIEALVIDSMSHEHEGEGGIEEIANLPLTQGKRMANWIGAKREHRRFMNTLLYLPCHVVCCFRAREKTDFKDPAKPVSRGMQPITEKNVMFEMTASFLLRDQGKSRDVIKLPECLRPILGGDGYLTPEHGRKLRDWVGGADPLERTKNILRLAASSGMAALGAAWGALSVTDKKPLAAFKETLKDLATHADSEKTTAKPDTGAPDGPEYGDQSAPDLMP